MLKCQHSGTAQVSAFQLRDLIFEYHPNKHPLSVFVVWPTTEIRNLKKSYLILKIILKIIIWAMSAWYERSDVVCYMGQRHCDLSQLMISSSFVYREHHTTAFWPLNAAAHSWSYDVMLGDNSALKHWDLTCAAVQCDLESVLLFCHTRWTFMTEALLLQ